ncbi:hypothetical protein DI270_033320 [Microbispora triticiradicis]|uniref:HNH endonuclease n=2 Tax=Microbispora triticiradicis TaxID=2200763 RepID=A0ABX9L9Y7_9ACTN|nr:HNH endonuclease [Microbispora triticiradicis]RGA00776.1 hypothetical protein DI270_033320 [Microbispora triticiradicis]
MSSDRYYLRVAQAQRRRIPDETRRALFDATDRKCTICRRPLDIEGGTRHIGEMGHIAPHSPDGPRREAARPAEVDGFDNLMLLCPSCHRTIDKEPDLWPEPYLRAIKAEHEGWVVVERSRPEPRRPPGGEPAGIGGTVEIEGLAYHVAGDPEEERSADGTAIVSRAFALTPDGGHVWIRRIAARSPGPAVLEWRAALAGEAGLLAEALPGLPPRVAASVTPETAVLVTAVPSFTTLAGFYDGRGREAEAVRVLGSGVAGLCEGLASLHDRGLAHGAVSPDSIMTDRAGSLFLRDAGHAFLRPDHAAEPAEPAEDVRRLAELIHVVVTGRPPIPLVSAAVLNPAVPERFAHALDRALSPDPAERGHILELGEGLRI